MEGIEKGSFSLIKFGNEKKHEGFDASRFLNPRRALYKRVGCSEFKRTNARFLFEVLESKTNHE